MKSIGLYGLQFALKIFLGISLVFIALRLAPGNPAELVLGPYASDLEIEALEKQLNLNLPLWKQYVKYLSDLVKLNFGESIFNQTSVYHLIQKSFAPTLIIAICSISMAIIIGLAVSFLTVFPLRKFDFLIRLISLSFLSIPIYSLAPLLIIVFSICLNLLPVSEWGTWRHVILPSLSVAIPLGFILSRVLRNAVLETVFEPWVTVLKSKGLAQNEIVLKVYIAILPTMITVLAMQLSVVLGGAIVTETVFDIPGLGSLLFEAINRRDYPVIQGVVLYIAVIYLFIISASEFINSKIDPRIRY